MTIIKNNKQVMVLMETVLAYFKTLFGHLLGGEKKISVDPLDPTLPNTNK